MAIIQRVDNLLVDIKLRVRGENEVVGPFVDFLRGNFSGLGYCAGDVTPDVVKVKLLLFA